jgi:hypothetical protein
MKEDVLGDVRNAVDAPHHEVLAEALDDAVVRKRLERDAFHGGFLLEARSPENARVRPTFRRRREEEIVDAARRQDCPHFAEIIDRPRSLVVEAERRVHDEPAFGRPENRRARRESHAERHRKLLLVAPDSLGDLREHSVPPII